MSRAFPISTRQTIGFLLEGIPAAVKEVDNVIQGIVMWMSSLAFNTAEDINGILINFSSTVMAGMGHTKMKSITDGNSAIIHS